MGDDLAWGDDLFRDTGRESRTARDTIEFENYYFSTTVAEQLQTIQEKLPAFLHTHSQL